MDEPQASRPYSTWEKIYKGLGGNIGSAIGGVIIIVLILVAIFAPLISPYDPVDVELKDRFLPPGSPGYLLGTDDFGRDLLSRLIFGSRTALLTGGVAVLIALSIGLIFGIISGYFSNLVDTLVMRFMDIMLSFPAILLAIIIVAMLGPSIINVIVAVGISQIPIFARLARSVTLSVRETEYIEAAVSIGAPDLRILSRHILPNIITPMIVQGKAKIGMDIKMGASLNFLGLGVQPPTPDWGAMINEGQKFVFQNRHIPVVPGIAIAITVISVNIWGDGLQRELDPSMRGR
jgi:peptide/nickel transport system permease protein